MEIVIALLAIYTILISIYVINMKRTYVSEKENIDDLWCEVASIQQKFIAFDELRESEHNVLRGHIDSKVEGMTKRITGINKTIDAEKAIVRGVNKYLGEVERAQRGVTETVQGLIRGMGRELEEEM